jgi:hypothetical protein
MSLDLDLIDLLTYNDPAGRKRTVGDDWPEHAKQKLYPGLMLSWEWSLLFGGIAHAHPKAFVIDC